MKTGQDMLKVREHNLLKGKDKYWRAFSRMQWLQFEDANRRFFSHKIIKRRQKKNKMVQIADNQGNRLTNYDSITTTFKNHL